MIYFDHNATTPVDAEVLEEMLPYLREEYGNPSSSHRLGQSGREAVDKARGELAALLGCQVGEVIFTGGGSEADNQAVKGIAEAMAARGNHIITSQIEHPAITNTCRYLEGKGCRVTYLSVDGTGMVDPEDVRRASTAKTILITIMHANNEIGTLQPISAIGEIAREKGIYLHTDAAQSVGKIPTLVDELKVDLLTVAGHKFYAPKGVGALYVRKGTQLPPLIHGAGHEGGLRAGTENVASIVGLGKAAQIAARDMERNITHLTELRDLLQSRLEEEVGGVRLNGHPEQHLPNTLNVSFEGLDSDELLRAVPELAASTGAACHAHSREPSAVLLALGVGEAQALGAVRFSLGRRNTREEVEEAVGMIAEAVRRLRAREAW